MLFETKIVKSSKQKKKKIPPNAFVKNDHGRIEIRNEKSTRKDEQNIIARRILMKSQAKLQNPEKIPPLNENNKITKGFNIKVALTSEKKT